MRRRVAVTVEEGVVQAAQAAVGSGRLPSVNERVASAMAERAKRERLAEVLAGTREELGPATDEEMAWARSVLGL
ncbi:MAG: hypothetical protein ACP5VR_06590 [Acidimicrobiales bacterium]